MTSHVILGGMSKGSKRGLLKHPVFEKGEYPDQVHMIFETGPHDFLRGRCKQALVVRTEDVNKSQPLLSFAFSTTESAIDQLRGAVVYYEVQSFTGVIVRVCFGNLTP